MGMIKAKFEMKSGNRSMNFFCSSHPREAVECSPKTPKFEVTVLVLEVQLGHVLNIDLNEPILSFKSEAVGGHFPFCSEEVSLLF